jgi:exopolyphosphatase/guanosine-5'-triphosphate,3'-diphosphate pyrophosphatase
LIHLSRPAADGPAPTRAKALRRFADRCRTDRRHGEQTARLARKLFDVLGKRLGCAPEDWSLLEAAALLHDVGQIVSYRSHHKHSYHLIAHAESLPFTPRERVQIALISRYHRKRGPSKKHVEYAALETEDRARVRRLAALLRVACGLDRSHVSAVEAMRLRMMPDRLLVDVVPRLVTTDLKLELWGAQRKADLLAKLLGREVVVRLAPLVDGKAAS